MQIRLIDIFADVLYKKLKPSEIIVDLYSERVVNKDIFDAVKRDEELNGESSATIVLIDNIFRCHRNWYPIFLEVLCRHKYMDIVKEIDDSFLESKNSHKFVNFFCISVLIVGICMYLSIYCIYIKNIATFKLWVHIQSDNSNEMLTETPNLENKHLYLYF